MKVFKFVCLLLVALFSSIPTSSMNGIQNEQVISQLKIADSLKFIEPEHALDLIFEIKESPNYKNIQDKIKVDLVLSNALSALGKYDSAIFILKEVSLKRKFNTDSIMQANVFHQLGINYTKKGEFALAAENLNTALKIYDGIKDIENKSVVLKDIGNVYFNLGQIETARLFYEKVLIIGKTVNNEILSANIYNNLGRIYIELNDFEVALNYLNLSYEIKLKHNNQLGMANTNINIAVTYQRKGQNAPAEEHFIKALSQMKEISNIEGETKVYHYLGILYTSEKRFDEAVEVLTKGLELSREMKVKKLCMEITKALSDAYNNQRKYEDALKYFKIYTQLKDSISADKDKLEHFDLKSEIEHDAFAARVDELKIQNTTLSHKNRNKNRLVVLLSVILITSIICFIRFKRE